MKPQEKSPETETFITNLFGVNRKQSIQDNWCVMCGEPATEFDNELSRQEYSISGLCQRCQDKVFDDGGVQWEWDNEV